MSGVDRHRDGGLAPIERDEIEDGTPGSRHATHLTPYVPFPLHVLPAALREIVEGYGLAIGCDPVFVVMPLLGVLAASIGNSRRLRLKRTWSEPSIVWVAAVATSGSLKTPAFTNIMKPFVRRQKEALKKYQRDMEEFRAELDRYEKARAKKNSADDELGPRPIEPTGQRLYCSDTTVEALASLLSFNPRGLLVSRDELSGWFASFDRYSQAKGGDVAHWLEMSSGSSMTIDRKTGLTKIIFVPRASVSIVGGVQPRVLRRLLGKEHFQNGLAARFLFMWPPRRQRTWTDNEVSAELESKFEQIVDKLCSLEMVPDADGDPGPKDLRLSDKAKQYFTNFVGIHGAEQITLTEDLSAAWSKLEAYAVRLALIIHLSRSAAGEAVDPEVVDVASMQAALAVTKWFCDETRRVYEMLSCSEANDAELALAGIVRAHGGRVSVGEWEHHRHLTRVAAETELGRLVSAGYGAWQHLRPGAGGGRPKKVFALVDRVLGTQTPAGNTLEGVSSQFHAEDEAESCVSGALTETNLGAAHCAACDETPAGGSRTGVCIDTEPADHLREVDWYESIQNATEVAVA